MTIDDRVLEALDAQLHRKDGTGVVKRLRRENLLAETGDIDAAAWTEAVDRLLDAGKILEYKISDLPGTLPLDYHSQTGYTTPAHLLGLLKAAKPHQVEELRDFLDYSGVPLPAVRTAVTAAQKKRIDNAVRKLNEVRAEIAARIPCKQVDWYLDASGDLNLMVEPEGQMEPQQQYIEHSARLHAIGAGDW